VDDAMSRREFLGCCAVGAAMVALPVGGGCAATPGPRSPAGPPSPAGSDPGAQVLHHFATFGVDLALMDRVLRAGLERGGEFCELFFEHTVTRSLALEDGTVDRAASDLALGLGIRVLRGEETGYAFTESLDPDSMLAAARLAGAIAQGGGAAQPQPLLLRGAPQHFRAEQPWDELAFEARLAVLQQAERIARREDGRIRKVSVSFVDQTRRILVANSEGLLAGDAQPLTRCIVQCGAQAGQRKEENSYNLSARAGFEYYDADRIRALGEEAARRTVALFEAQVPPAGEMPLVLAAGSSGILLHEAIGHGMEADFNRKGVSIYAERMGQAIARDLVTIVDDGTNYGLRGSINIDDEGNPAERTVLVEGGVLRSFLHDRISARHYGVAATGSGRRESYRFLPLPRMRNTYMLPGPHSREEILRSVDRGIYAESFSNGQVQIGAGDFSFYIKTGYLIEGGRLTRPVKDVNIIGNGPQVLEAVSMVADDLALDTGGWTCGKRGQGVPVSLGLPTVRVDRITVGGVDA